MYLTELAIKKLQPAEQSYTVFDDQLNGFGVRVGKRRKTFTVLIGHHRMRVNLGHFPDTKLVDARNEAKKLLAGVTPTEAPQNAATGFLEAKERFLDESETRHKRQTTLDYRRHLDHYAFRTLAEITRADVMERLRGLQNQPVTQNHVFSTMKTFLNWCVANDYLDRNPLDKTKKPAPKRHRERVLTEDELRAVYQRAEQYGFPYGHIVRLLILTGQRRGEILNLTRDRVADTLQFPDTKNRTDHAIPLLPLARSVIESIPHRQPYLFQHANQVPFSAFSKAKVQFDAPLSIAPYRLHDLRRTFSSTMAMLGTPLHVTERILNHKSGTISGVSAIYNRYTFMKEMETALETFEQYIATLLASGG